MQPGKEVGSDVTHCTRAYLARRNDSRRRALWVASPRLTTGPQAGAIRAGTAR